MLKKLGPVCTAICLAGVCSLPALEPWADGSLPVKEGLELWLDAARENAARSIWPGAHGRKEMPHVANNASLDIWHDASGNKGDAVQFAPDARPRLIQSAQGMAVRFDGTNDFLMMSGKERNLTNLTIFIQAAPRSNKGDMRAFMAVSRRGQNDYSDGLNVDLGPKRADKVDTINIEGDGFTGIWNLLKAGFAFDQTHLFTILSGAETRRVELWADGVFQDARERTALEIGFDLLTLGARFYSNSGEPAHVQGFLDGDISQVLIYNRVLDAEEHAEVERFLAAKALSLHEPGKKQVALETITNAPPVRMFLPGFEVKELPIQLKNINCVKYRPDGKLVALGYDGNIWLLSDTDGDGLEDKASPFWSQATLRAPIGMALTPDHYPLGRGVFVPSKGKLSLIVDTNGDDVADQEIVIAKGWTELPHGVDALGAAVDKDGSVYFGLGTANYTDAYLVDPKTGKAGYSLQSERGTILRVSPDFSSREIICTGIRFPVGMAFNGLGDLFCTDQEGATWLPNGNPFDELLFIQRGRHYGFPPRHPNHLPAVIDEPSVFDYGPQHQSTCGLSFNEPVNGGPVFGPANWQGDALVAGYSRGKLYRTRLVKSKSGYVAQNQIIASLNALPADVCVSPGGDLVIATHSGKPDWGSGPTGPGKLYKVFYSRNDTPQPVAIWPSSPTETVIEFDRPLDPAQLRDWRSRITVTEGRYVGAGDRFEVLRPGYQAVVNQLAEPRFELEVHSTALAADGKTLAIRTTPRSAAVNYALSLPSLGAALHPDAEAGLRDTTELACDLSGAEANWEPASGQGKLAAWLPHLDLTVARQLTKASATASTFWGTLPKAGKLTLRTQLDLRQMLRAATQPGPSLDFEYPDETVTLVLSSDRPFEVRAPLAKVARIDSKTARLVVATRTNSWIPLEVSMKTVGGLQPTLDVAWFTAEDDRLRALPLRRILLPWATPAEAHAPPAPERTIPELVGGDWLSGRRIFFGEKVACSKCHALHGRGARIGPDLSHLFQRDYASVLKDIVEPNAAINPDHVAYNLEFKDGSEPVSAVQVGGDESKLLMADASGRINSIARSNVRSMLPAAKSLMPEGLLTGLSDEERKDLMTFLLTPEPLQPATIDIAGTPLPRKRSEAEVVLGAPGAPGSPQAKPIRIVLCAGPKDHGPSEHDYPLWQKRWSKLLALAEHVSVETAWEWPTPDQFKKADAVVFYSDNPGWSTNRAHELDAFLNRGGGLVYIHFAVDGHGQPEELAQRIGLAWSGASRFRHGLVELKFEPHPITEHFQPASFLDEAYWNLTGREANIRVLASGIEDGKSRPLMWVREQGQGRIFVSIPGHYTWTFDDPLFRTLLLRGIAWSAHQPLDRFNDLVTIGARAAE